MPSRRSATASASSEGPAYVAGVADPGPYEPDAQATPPPAAPRRRTSKSKPKAASVDTQALADLCVLFVGICSYVLGLIAAAPDMALANDLSMTEKEALQVGTPLAHMLSGAQLIQRYAAWINNGNDAAQLVGGLFDYLSRVAVVYYERHPIRGRVQSVSPTPGTSVPGSVPVGSATGPAVAADGQPSYNGSVPSHLLAA